MKNGISIFRNLPDDAIGSLVTLINDSIEKGVFPECLKTAIVIPLHKGRDRDDLNNYRPIAPLPALSKIIERLIKKQLMCFLKKIKIITSRQFGFLSNSNTADALFSVFNEVYNNINNKHFTATVFSDFSKAFDCVSHDI